MGYIIVLACIVFFGFLSVPTSFAQIYINEFASASGDDWIEIYNDSDEAISLSGFTLRDNTESNKKDLEGEVPAKGYLIIEWTRLNIESDSIRLLQGDTVEDEISYGTEMLGAPSAEQSAGRASDGADAWQLFSAHSKGSSNTEGEVHVPPTPSPTITPTPTKIPTPTKTPRPTPTVYKTSTITSDPTMSVGISPSPSAKPSISGIKKNASDSGETLGVTDAKVEQNTPVPKSTKTLGATKKSPYGLTIVGGGVLLLITCGILIFQKYKRYFFT